MMLPTELIRARRQKGKLLPRFIEGKISIAETLIAVYQDHLEMKKRALNEALTGCEELGYNYKMVRGLAAVLEPRAVFQPRSVIPPMEARSRVFKEAGKRAISTEQDRLNILKKVSGDMGISVNELNESLYADLEVEHILVKFTAPIPEELLKHYNFSLSCALLAYSRLIDLYFEGEDEYITQLASNIGDYKVNTRNMTQITINLKPTKRISLRGSKISTLLGRLISLPRWSLNAEVAYPVRYKNTVTLELNWYTARRIIKRDTLEANNLIEIP
jgi:predicted nuclease of restriction endonuclease-like RecB superfamily